MYALAQLNFRTLCGEDLGDCVPGYCTYIAGDETIPGTYGANATCNFWDFDSKEERVSNTNDFKDVFANMPTCCQVG